MRNSIKLSIIRFHIFKESNECTFISHLITIIWSTENRNNLQLLVRSHEVKDDGYAVEHGGKCITIFSAPNYCDQMGNKGAFIRFFEDMKPNYTQFDAVPHPNIPPMKYASNMFGL